MFGTTTVAAPAYAAPAMASYAAPAMAPYAAPAMTSYAAAATTSYAAPTMASYAAPAMTSYAAPATTSYAAPAYAAPTMATVAAPAMTTMAPSFVAPPAVAAPAYAAPTMASYAAPAMAPAYAAPTMATVAAPAMTTMAPSFVAPPAVAPVPMVPQAALAPPVSLTANIPNPEQIAKQKAGYMAALDKQLKEATDTVVRETEIEKQMVAFTAKKNVAMNEMQTQEWLTEQLAASDEQTTIMQCELKKALVERNLQLNSQADNLIMDYKMKALVSDCEMKKYQFAQQYMKEENKLAGQFMQQEIKAHTGTAYGAPAPAVPTR